MQSTSFKNHFLIATPSLNDDNFKQSVIFLCEHSDDGAMGIMINKSLNIRLSSVLEHLDIKQIDESVLNETIYMGGPVGQEHGFVIHEPYRDDEHFEDLVISASTETLNDIATGQGPNAFLVTLGYAGWSAGQLEEEINHNDWLLVPYDKRIIFNTPRDLRWQRAIELLGFTVDQLAMHEGHA